MHETANTARQRTVIPMTTKFPAVTSTKSNADQLLLFIKQSILAIGFFGCLFFAYTAGADSDFNVRDVSAVEAAELLKSDPDIKVLDVRTGFEFNRGHIENAVNFNYYSRKFKDNLDTLDKNITWLVHCRTGVRSGKTLPLMKAAGFTNIIHMQDGIVDWTKSGLPVVK